MFEKGGCLPVEYPLVWRGGRQISGVGALRSRGSGSYQQEIFIFDSKISHVTVNFFVVIEEKLQRHINPKGRFWPPVKSELKVPPPPSPVGWSCCSDSVMNV